MSDRTVAFSCSEGPTIPHCEECASQLLVDGVNVGTDEKNLAAGAILRLLAMSAQSRSLTQLKSEIANKNLIEQPWNRLAVDIALHELIEKAVITGPSPYSVHHQGSAFNGDELFYRLAIDSVCPGH